MLCYELGIDIQGGELTWIKGPYPTGKQPNIKNFYAVLVHFLKHYEHVEANNGWHTNKVKCPLNNIAPVKKLAMQRQVRSCHKTINSRLKNWVILPSF